jgi:hypothetical protein
MFLLCRDSADDAGTVDRFRGGTIACRLRTAPAQRLSEDAIARSG